MLSIHIEQACALYFISQKNMHRNNMKPFFFVSSYPIRLWTEVSVFRWSIWDELYLNKSQQLKLATAKVMPLFEVSDFWTWKCDKGLLCLSSGHKAEMLINYTATNMNTSSSRKHFKSLTPFLSVAVELALHFINYCTVTNSCTCTYVLSCTKTDVQTSALSILRFPRCLVV